METAEQVDEAWIALATFMHLWRNKDGSKGTAPDLTLEQTYTQVTEVFHASHVALQGFIASVCKLWFDAWGFCLGSQGASLISLSVSCCITRYPS